MNWSLVGAIGQMGVSINLVAFNLDGVNVLKKLGAPITKNRAHTTGPGVREVEGGSIGTGAIVGL
jgi:hypothetical protein